MRQLTVNIEDDKYSFFLGLMKSIDFVSVDDELDWYDDLFEADKNHIQEGVDDINPGRVVYNEKAKERSRKKIFSFKS